ncbi:hypothetical protein CVU83_01685 [Candidatus Falkowbacteria bacterium HGW-Falkowbacteria-2]|uniref:Uncharacterized protein n=1 Tax=Candidatus Falkowbacteria bacterium HGW-Falkowbacteria-2 TaxID=2013769 RepID=A0A2N2E141_9BACT|nr:MAG: hypothetical protein CVU83_01685 [Candidatus Falkowbacteria bacterium HGW-Falkowbacteria-2]
MPLTPSIGLSVLVHLIVLIISGLRRLFRSKKKNRRIAARERRSRSPALVSRFLGMMIPLTISVVIFSGAFKLVELALKNRFSSIHLAQQYIAATRAEESAADASADESPNRSLASLIGPAMTKDVGPLETGTSSFNCLPLFNHFAVEYDWSVVNYLAAKGQPHSLADRQALADQLGVSDYDGSNAKNTELFKALYLESNDENIANINACDLFIANN